jgi:hypothetical protein
MTAPPPSPPYAEDATVAVGTGDSLAAALDQALGLAGFAELRLEGRRAALLSAAAADTGLGDGLADAVRRAGAATVARVECPSTDTVEIELGAGLGRAAVARAWHDADFRVLIGHNRAHPRWLYGGAMLAVLRALGSPVRGELPVVCRALLEALPVHFAALDAWSSRDRSRTRATGAVLVSRNAFALDWMAGEKMDLDPALNGVVREGVLRWGRIRLDRRGNETPWDPWANATVLGAALADVRARLRGPEEVTWTAR